jgi:hypothetical protein
VLAAVAEDVVEMVMMVGVLFGDVATVLAVRCAFVGTSSGC